MDAGGGSIPMYCEVELIEFIFYLALPMFLKGNIKSSCIGMKYFGSPRKILHSRKVVTLPMSLSD